MRLGRVVLALMAVWLAATGPGVAQTSAGVQVAASSDAPLTITLQDAIARARANEPQSLAGRPKRRWPGRTWCRHARRCCRR